eukprot:5484193-Heterocapsa_arctica.AAC.1
MLKAKQIQMHSRAKTNKARLGKYVIDKSDIEDNSGVIKNSRIFQKSIDEKNDRDRQEEVQRLNKIKVAEDREKRRTNKVKTIQETQQAENDDTVKVAEERENKRIN